MPRLRVALVFHHHQPWYLDPEGIFRQPWLFTNGPRYLDHLVALEGRPDLRVTLNLQPVMMLQWLRASRGYTYQSRGGNLLRYPPASTPAVLARRLLEGYRRVARRGSVEFLTSPFYHPIMALLASRGFGEDLAWQLDGGTRTTRRILGVEPRGLWVPELAFNMAALPFVEGSGLEYLVLEGSLLRGLGLSLGEGFRLGEVGVLPRHTHISNHLAFDWNGDLAGWGAAEKCVRHLGRSAGNRRFIVLALDGENWMRGPGLLNHLYDALEGARGLELITLGEIHDEGDLEALAGVPEGSWGVGNDLSTWIGSPQRNRYWSLLARARHAIEESPAGRRALGRAREHLRIAEASDYTYWGAGALMDLGRAHAGRAIALAQG